MSGDLPVYVEVTTTVAARFTAGYERVVRSVLAGLAGPDGRGIEAIPVVATGGPGNYRRLTDSEAEALRHHPPGGTTRRRADRFGPLSPAVRRLVGLPVVGRTRDAVRRQGRRLTVSPAIRALNIDIPAMGSVWLDLEPAWNDPEPRAQLLTRLRVEGVHTAVMIADVMPELFPEWFDANQRRLFGAWLQAHLEHSALFLCISRNSERDLREVARRRGVTRDLNTVVIPLGADLPVAEPEPVALPPEMGRYLLVVGTLEPRKNQQLVIDAFDRLRRRHDDLGLVLVGRQGWLMEGLVERIRSHPEFGRRLLWPDGVSDGELAWLYRHAFLTVAPSRYEGLGVPVMEALHHGCATISSTGGALPEAGDGRVETIDPDDVDALCVTIERHLLDAPHHDRLRDLAAGYRSPSWHETTVAVADALRGFADMPPATVPPTVPPTVPSSASRAGGARDGGSGTAGGRK